MTPGAASAAAANGNMAARSPEEMKRAMEEMKKNPEMMKNMGEAREGPFLIYRSFHFCPIRYNDTDEHSHNTGAALTASPLSSPPQMMGTLSEEQLKEISRNAPPGMPQVTPELAKQAAEMMKAMSPEDMGRMMEMAQKMGPMAGMGMGAGGAGGDRAESGAAASSGAGMPQMTPDMMAKMGETMKDPKMMEARAIKHQEIFVPPFPLHCPSLSRSRN